MKNIKHGENTEALKRFHASVTIQGIELTSFGRFFFFISVPISEWFGTGLSIMSRDKKHTSNECSEQRAKTQMACKNLDLNHVGPIETQYTNTAPVS